MQHDPSDGDALSSLLSILKSKESGSSITSVISATTIDLLCSLLYPEDYVSVATRLSEISDVVNVVDFILHLLRDRRLTSPDPTTDFNRRARRLMFKIISMNPVIPRSLIVTEVKVPSKRDYIGGGAFGGVCKGELRGKIIALKVLYRTGDNVAFCREALMWAMLKHEFVLSFLGIYIQQEEMFLVSPYMENGTLAQWRKNANPSVHDIWERILEVAEGMEYIHSEGIVHGDLRGDNILLDANLHIQIADFGLTRLIDATNTQSGAKHLNFSAPELFGFLDDADDPSAVEPARTQMSDVYAFGCFYYEIYYDSIPFAGRPEGQIIALVIRDKRPDRLYEPPLSDGAWEVIQRCWAREPWKRPRMKDVIESLVAISQSMSLSTNVRFPVTSAFSTTTLYKSPRILDSTLSSLLSLLNDKKPGSSIASVVNATTINLIRKLLSKEDYISVAGDLIQASDAKNLLDFMLHLLHDHRSLNQDPTVNINQRARHFMTKVISKIPVIPPSLIVTGVRMPVELEYIGLGGFGRVFKGELQGAAVALKVLCKSNHDVAFCREALMWRFLKHKFVLPFLGIYECDEMASEFILVSPYMRSGTLSQWRKQTNPSISVIEKRILQVAQGLEYIHSEGIVHGGIRGANILLDDKLHVQIAGFGLTRLSAAKNTQSGFFHINFAAPELFGISDDSYRDVPLRTQMSDVYALGCLYYEIHYGTMPFANKNMFQILTLVTRGVLPSRLNKPPLSDGAWDIIQCCWTREPLKRPRIKDVVEGLTWLMLNE